MKRLAVLGTLLLAACASMPSNDAGEAIRSMSRDFGTAAGSGNVDAMMSIYADDAVLMPPNLPAFRGRNAIRQFWSGFLGAGKIEATLTPDNIMQSCDMATEVGHYALSITPTGVAPIKDVGKYVVTWRRIGGQWRAVADIFNSDQPK